MKKKDFHFNELIVNINIVHVLMTNNKLRNCFEYCIIFLLNF